MIHVKKDTNTNGDKQTSMPVMGGLEATNIIRTQPPFSTDIRLRTTPIIGLVAHALLRDQEILKGRGYDDVITKPFRLSVIKQILLRRSQWELSSSRTSMVPTWGPYPLRAYRGPRSRL